MPRHTRDKINNKSAARDYDRRGFLGTAAAGVGMMMATPALACRFSQSAANKTARLPKMAGRSGAPTCAHWHQVMSAELGRFTCDPANDVAAVNKALRSTICPDCGTKISADLSQYRLKS